MRLVQTWYNSGDYQNVLDASEGLIPPFPLFLMKSLMYLGLSAQTSGILLNLVLGGFTPLLAYGIAYETTQRKDIAICTAILITVHPSMNKLSVQVQRDMVYLFFTGLELWFLVIGIRYKQWFYWLLSGIVCGCAILTRYEAFEMIVIVPLILILLYVRKNLQGKQCVSYLHLFYVGIVASIISLSFMMQIQINVFTNYNEYFRRKIGKEEIIHQVELNNESQRE